MKKAKRKQQQTAAESFAIQVANRIREMRWFIKQAKKQVAIEACQAWINRAEKWLPSETDTDRTYAERIEVLDKKSLWAEYYRASQLASNF